MKDRLIRVFQLLNIINISGQQNILALGECINIMQSIINEIVSKEESVEINNTKKEDK